LKPIDIYHEFFTPWNYQQVIIPCSIVPFIPPSSQLYQYNFGLGYITSRYLAPDRRPFTQLSLWGTLDIILRALDEMTFKV